jgi:hypothetical protein
MKRLRILATAMMLVGGLVFAGPPEAQASVLCNGEYVYLALYQNSSYGGQCLGVKTPGNTNSAGIYNMNALAGPCWHPGFPASWSWGDCVSSLKWSINSCHWHFSLYQDVGYGGSVLYSYDGGPNVNIASMPTGKNDQASSVLVYYTSGCVTAPAP